MSDAEEMMLAMDDTSERFNTASHVVTSREGMSDLRRRLQGAEKHMKDHRIVEAWIALKYVRDQVTFLEFHERRALPLVEEEEEA